MSSSSYLRMVWSRRIKYVSTKQLDIVEVEFTRAQTVSTRPLLKGVGGAWGLG